MVVSLKHNLMVKWTFVRRTVVLYQIEMLLSTLKSGVLQMYILRTML